MSTRSNSHLRSNDALRQFGALLQVLKQSAAGRDVSVLAKSTAVCKKLAFDLICSTCLHSSQAMQSAKTHRKVSPTAEENDDFGDKVDELLLSFTVANGEDLGPFIRKTFAAGKSEALFHHSLRHFARSKEANIEEVCKAHYQDFILAVDDFRSLLSNVDLLKFALVESRTVSYSVDLALAAVAACVCLVDLCACANRHLLAGDFYMALRCVDAVDPRRPEPPSHNRIAAMPSNPCPL